MNDYILGVDSAAASSDDNSGPQWGVLIGMALVGGFVWFFRRRK